MGNPTVADEVFGIFAQRGAPAYFGESVSVTEHALQAAWFAQQEGAPGSLGPTPAVPRELAIRADSRTRGQNHEHQR